MKRIGIVGVACLANVFLLAGSAVGQGWGDAPGKDWLRGDWLGIIESKNELIELSFDTLTNAADSASTNTRHYFGTCTAPYIDWRPARTYDVHAGSNSMTMSLPEAQTTYSAHWVTGTPPHLVGTWTKHGEESKLTMIRAETYVGILGAPVDSLHVVFKFAKTEKDVRVGTFASPDERSRIDPCTRVKDSAGLIDLSIPKISSTLTAKRSADKRTIEGTLVDRQKRSWLFLTEDPGPHYVRRPQQPYTPYPYRSEAVSLRNETQAVELAGTLTVPNAHSLHPAVILLPGSFNFDRDESESDHKPLMVIADYLTRHGFATLRLDNRGVGTSRGSSADASINDLATDIAAAIHFLKAQADIDPKNIGICAHGEGSLVAETAIARDTSLRFLVILAGPGMRGDKVHLARVEHSGRASGAPSGEVRHQFEATSILDSIIVTASSIGGANKQITEYETHLHDSLFELRTPSSKTAELFEKSFREILASWLSASFQSVLRSDPFVLLRSVGCPVLAIGGTLDREINTWENLPAIESALHSANNPDFSTKSYRGLNHFFQHAVTGEKKEYQRIEETISPEVLDDIAAWLTTHTAPR